jgi:hypothetical protein
MKKVYPIILLGVIVFSGFGASGITINHSILNTNNEPAPEFAIKIYGGFGITLIIKNVGDAAATNVTTFGGFFGGTTLSKNTFIKHLKDISPGKSAIVRFRFFGYGIGLFQDTPEIQTKVWCDEGAHNETYNDAWVLLNLVLFR